MLDQITGFAGLEGATDFAGIAIDSIQLLHPEYLWVGLGLLVLLLIMLKIDFVKLDDLTVNKAEKLKSRSRYRIFIFITRVLVLGLILLALAQPYIEIRREIPGKQTLTILLDNSSSMGLFDTSFVPQLREELNERIPTTVRQISTGLDSRIGDGVLANLEKNKNLLLVTDGQNNYGTDLGDVSLFAASLNATISAIRLEPKSGDVAVYIFGPSKTMAGVENTYKAVISKAGSDSVQLTVKVDGETVLDQTTTEDTVTFQRNFTDGYHELVAEVTPIGSDDLFTMNNKFMRTTHVIEKPEVLIVSKERGPFHTFLNQLYDVTEMATLPASFDEFDKFYAVILNDLDRDALRVIKPLRDYVTRGNGLLAVGGFNSFDKGGYKGAVIESILPVYVGTGEKRPGDASIVLVIDISGTMVEPIYIEDGEIVDKPSTTLPLSVSKALALSALDNINENNQVGVVAFTDQVFLVSDIKPLFVNKGELINKISRLQGGGQTDFAVGLKGAFQLLHGKTGGKNVVIITDGKTNNPFIRNDAKNVVRAMYDAGIRTYVVGQGRDPDEDFLSSLGASGGGFYMRATDANRLSLVFGEPEDKEVGTAFYLVPLDSSHFITKQLETDAVLYGYNQVVPKKNARLLMVTDSGRPALTVWRYGIGRVGALTVFSGDNNLGELLLEDNSIVLSRIINWIIADPERKEDFFISIEDARINRTAEVTIKTDQFPKAEGMEFAKTGDDLYRATFISRELGFQTLFTAKYAVNYDKEFQETGWNTDLESAVTRTGGKIFKPDELDDIVEYVKTVSKRVIVRQEPIQWPVIGLAILIFLIEVMIRRIRQTWWL